MRVFVSYSHRDKEAARRIADDLRQRGISVLMDEDVVAPGEQWADKISDAFEESDAVIVLISRNTNESRFQTSEIAFAIARQRKAPSTRVIPVLIDREADLPFFLRDVLYCNLASEEQYESNFDSLVQALTRPQSEPDLSESDRRRIEAIKTERVMLARHEAALAKRKALWMSTALGALASVMAAVVTFVVGAASFQASFLSFCREYGGFFAGILVGVACVLVAFLVSRRIQAKHSREGEDDGE